jgi:hypothetical protein
VEEAAQIMAGIREKEMKVLHSLSAHNPNDGEDLWLGAIPSNFYHLPIAPEAGDQVFNTGAFGRHSRSKYVMVCMLCVPLQKAQVLKAYFLSGGAIFGRW